MPIYEYICNKCSHIFDVLRLSSSGDKVTCPSCGAGDVAKKLSTFSCSLPAGGGAFTGGT